MSCHLLDGAGGLRVEVLDYGAVIRSVLAPDRFGRFADVVLGQDALTAYERDRYYYGAMVGRYAGRIRRGEFELDGERYRLPINGGEHHLHGGLRGFGKVVWRARPFVAGASVGVVLEHVSPDDEEGYPGTLTARVTYAVSPGNVLSVEHAARTDRPTPLNLTQHSYFNLAGEASGNVLGHELRLHADRYLPLGDDMIPTGEIAEVAGTPFDFRDPHAIGERIGADHEQLRIGGGYDHCFALRGGGLAPAARLRDPRSGRVLEVLTTEPGLQVYTANFLDATEPAKAGHRYGPRAGVCLETQHFPDSPNQPHFPSTILRPGEERTSRTEFRFSVDR